MTLDTDIATITLLANAVKAITTLIIKLRSLWKRK